MSEEIEGEEKSVWRCAIEEAKDLQILHALWKDDNDNA
jgi:hypothetical protein